MTAHTMMYNSIIWKRTALLLAVALAAVTASPAYVPVYEYNVTTNLLSTVMLGSRVCTNPGDAFKGNDRICVDAPLLKDLNKNSTEIVGYLKSSTDLLIFLAYLSRYNGPLHQVLYHIDMNAVSTFLKSLKEDGLQNLPETTGDVIYSKLIPLMTKDQTKKLKSTLVKTTITSNVSDGEFRRLLDSLHKEVLSDHLSLIKEELEKRKNLRLWKLGDDLLTLLLEDDGFCGSVDAKTILSLGERKDRAKKISPKCFAQVDWGGADCDLRIRSFDVKVFSEMEKGMNSSCLRLFTEPMVEKYASSLAKEGEYHCPNLDIQHLTMAAVEGLSPACLASPYTKEGSAAICFGPRWLAVSDKSLAAFGDNQDAIKRIALGDWIYITLAQKTEFLKVLNDECKIIPAEFFMYNRGMKLSNECFENLDPSVKGFALLSAVLDDNVLAKVTSMSDWKGLDSNLQSVEGIKILELAGEVKNIDKIISLMSSEDSNSDVCNEASDFKEMKVLQKHCSQKCIESLPEKITFETLGELDPRIFSMVPFEQFMEANGSEWSNIKPDHFRNLMDGGKLCKILEEGHLDHLNEESIKVMDAQCVSELTMLDKLPDRFYSAVMPSALRKLDADMVEHLKLEKFSDDQFAELGADTGDKHPATKWTSDIVKALSETRIARVEASTWAKVPAAAYAGITAFRIGNIPADNMISMSDAQVREIPNDAIQKLSEEQAQTIGKSHDGAAQSPLAYLVSIATDAKVKTVLQDRIPPPA